MPGGCLSCKAQPRSSRQLANLLGWVSWLAFPWVAGEAVLILGAFPGHWKGNQEDSWSTEVLSLGLVC